MRTHDESTSDLPDEIALLASAGIGAVLVYDGDADPCPLCLAQVLAQAA